MGKKTVAKTVKKLHKAMVKKNEAKMEKLFAKGFERYTNGEHHQGIAGEADFVQGVLKLQEKGTFTRLDFSQPLGTHAEATVHFVYSYVPHGSSLIFSNHHLIQMRINKKGQISFLDAYFDPEPVNALEAFLVSQEISAQAAKAGADKQAEK
jgi:hypothetical protein